VAEPLERVARDVLAVRDVLAQVGNADPDRAAEVELRDGGARARHAPRTLRASRQPGPPRTARRAARASHAAARRRSRAGAPPAWAARSTAASSSGRPT